MRYGIALWTLLLAPALFTPPSFAAEPSPLPVIVQNDNLTPAGK
jgi:hypothetical protein